MTTTTRSGRGTQGAARPRLCPSCRLVQPYRMFMLHGRRMVRCSDCRSNRTRSRIRVAGRKGYQEYLKSQHWRDLKKAYFQHYPKECRGCGSKDHIDLHHRSYKYVGDEHFWQLIPLCRDCHQAVHRLQRRHPRWSIGKATSRYLRRLDVTSTSSVASLYATSGRN